MGSGRPRAGWLASPPPTPRRAVVRSPHFPVWGSSARRSRFASCQRGRERRGAQGGRGRPPSPTRPATPDLPRVPCTRPLGRPASYRARSLAWFSSLAGRPAGGRRRPPPGAEACQAGGEGRAAASLAMSSPHDASGDFPLHLLVWNNDYRQLEKELRDQVRG